MTPDETKNPDQNTPDTPQDGETGRHRWERTVPFGRRLRASFLGETADRAHRVAPKMRSLQVGAAVAAFGVLGVFTAAAGGEDVKTESAPVHQAAEVAPLVAPAPQVPAPAPAPAVQPQAAPAPVAQPAPAAEPAPAAQPAPAPAPAAAPVQEDKPKDQIDAWIKEAIKVMEQNGISRDQIDEEAIRTIIMHESNGNPSATNNWDSNAAAGTPSIGLMQTIQPTFESFALPGHQDIYNPVDNIIAATRYSIDRYGSIADVPGVSGLRSGGSYQGY
ncbi:transglycosylase SLT domain-containing protein [Saccharopolyspora mangrovi]|uniref:Transglycosylase SLT domain-containing protein n=1 Tax=Saccharopolyspora mangrovi TaxID=3082379 RepID=A0ABU6A6A2_9PSEU|nr:transglycosylase SLT domain-containing protein [Saccharopolyspora sp. S2-29]MEB3367089.1 transglycosylase SLT domain-containing protein [Saccharopolyspora sp. S2-29]